MNTQRTFLKYVAITFAASIFMFACKKGDDASNEQPEKQVPTVEITSPGSQATKWNTILLKLIW